MPQLYTFSTVDNGYNFTDPARGDNAQISWPTVASSSLRLYTSDTIPNWNVTFMMATLKGGRFFQIALNGNGTALAQNPVELFHSENRYRDVEFGPDGRTIYVITDSFGAAQALKGGATTDLWTPGSLLMFRMREGRAKLATLFEQISLTLFLFFPFFLRSIIVTIMFRAHRNIIMTHYLLSSHRLFFSAINLDLLLWMLLCCLYHTIHLIVGLKKP